ncbi:membrane-associated Zn-dependent protease 1 [Plesiomonas sp.]|uniref:membrane-associated Zn-dependent protease 1 n=1 Tax=Plesiomonas sp. TaxID=2486279 RepID=UPI003F2FB228
MEKESPLLGKISFSLGLALRRIAIMSLRSFFRIGRFLVLFPLLSSASVYAAGQAHLLFHMGLGANGQFFVGGTIQNKGDAPITSGYVTVLTVSENCKPEKTYTFDYAAIEPNQKIEFRVPIAGRLEGYRLVGFDAFDDMGFELPVVDETHEIIKQREPEERSKCLLSRDKTVKTEAVKTEASAQP